jgi:hypothetical protein
LEASKVGVGVGAGVGVAVGTAGAVVHATRRKKISAVKEILLFIFPRSHGIGWIFCLRGIHHPAIIIAVFPGAKSDAVDNLFCFHDDGMRYR